jgi:hypothetical protein
MTITTDKCRDICAACNVRYLKTSEVLNCFNCDKFFHRYCTKVKNEEYKLIKKKNNSFFVCDSCIEHKEISMVKEIQNIKKET